MEKDVKRTFERVLLLAALAFCGAASAATVTADQAKIAVQRWLRDDPALGCPIQGTVGEVRTCTPANGASFHVVKLATGGFVVTSAGTALLGVFFNLLNIETTTEELP